MPVMRVWEMRVVMCQGLVAVRMAMAVSAYWAIGLTVAVLMMCIVMVRVAVFDRLMGMKMLMALGQM